jgi:hypothetical protein
MLHSGYIIFLEGYGDEQSYEDRQLGVVDCSCRIRRVFLWPAKQHTGNGDKDSDTGK